MADEPQMNSFGIPITLKPGDRVVIERLTVVRIFGPQNAVTVRWGEVEFTVPLGSLMLPRSDADG